MNSLLGNLTLQRGSLDQPKLGFQAALFPNVSVSFGSGPKSMGSFPLASPHPTSGGFLGAPSGAAEFILGKKRGEDASFGRQRCVTLRQVQYLAGPPAMA